VRLDITNMDDHDHLLCGTQEVVTLYRSYDKEGVLLYVGVTNAYWRRRGQHSASSPWRDLATKWTREEYPTRAAALEAERHAIQNENPIYNTTGKIRVGRVTMTPPVQWSLRPLG
jgi:hypothetical protein